MFRSFSSPMKKVRTRPEIDPGTIPDLGDRLLYAAEKNCLAVVTEILHLQPTLVSRRRFDGYTPLHRASYNNHREVAAELLKHGANVRSQTEDGWHPLHSACRWNSVEVASLLLHNGADINAQTKTGLTPLHLAANDRNARRLIVLLLLQPCVDTTLRSHAGETAVDLGVRSGPHAHLFSMSSNDLVKL